VELCWEVGIFVIHLAHVPRSSKCFDGMAAFCESRPVIVLGSKRDSPSWLVFHLAHELGHVISGHVRPGSPPVTDGDLKSKVGDDRQEKEADQFACEVLTGFKQPRIDDLKLSGSKLARKARQVGPSQGVDPGVFALIYGRSNDRWAAAQKALNLLGAGAGAHRIIYEQLGKRLADLDVPESTARFLSILEPNRKPR
jgi:hypothetical protein